VAPTLRFDLGRAVGGATSSARDLAARARNGLRYAARLDVPDVGLTPKDTVWSYEKAELWRYRSDRRSVSPPLLIVHSLVSRSYVLDLMPGNSFVERLRDAGLDVLLLDWGVPDDEDSTNDIETYVDDYLPRAVRAALDVTGASELTVLGYCLGGLLSMITAARHPELPVRNLITMATAVDFSEVGLVGTLLGPHALEPAALLDDTGNLPPRTIALGIKMLKPTADAVAYARLWQYLSNDEYVRGLRAMERWTRGHIPLSGALFVQGVELLVHDNALMNERLRLGGELVDLRRIRCPFLAIVADDDYVVPKEAVEPVAGLVGSDDLTLLHFKAGHIAFVAGREASRTYVREIVDWIVAHSDTATA
jgi:polyhydroxyalkanoate synthase